MKAILLLVLTPLLLIGCSSQDIVNLDLNKSNLTGTWKLSELYSDPGDGSGSFENVEDGYEFTLQTDGTFTSERLGELCDRGRYRITDGTKLIFQFDCPDFNEEYIDVASFDGRKLILSPIFPLVCIEGCRYKFVKQ